MVIDPQNKILPQINKTIGLKKGGYFKNLSAIDFSSSKNFKTNTISFAGDKDILIIDEDELLLGKKYKYWKIEGNEELVRLALGQKANEYTIHKAIGGKAGLKKAKECKPILTITAYNMRNYLPDGVELIKALKELGTKVIVFTSNWYRYGIESIRAGVKKCEEEAGADKYVYGHIISRSDFKNAEDYDLYSNHYSWNKVLQESVKAIINGTPIPKYPFQNEVEEETNK